MRRLDWWKTACAVCVLCVTTAIALPAQTFTTLHSFGETDGSNPFAALVQATDGSLYGTTAYGGADGFGTVFKITVSGSLTTLHTFDSTDGSDPNGGLVQAKNGSLYGATYTGGANGLGTIFKIALDGTLTTLYSFCAETGCTDGSGPYAALVQAPNGDLYGTTETGGTNGLNDGTVFNITPSGTLTTLYSFCLRSHCRDGEGPDTALVQATNGNFYGTTYQGGTNDRGSLFKITPSGTLTTLYSFCAKLPCPDGEYPGAALIQATDGNLYGTTSEGGKGTCHCGTVFKITPSGVLTTLYTFDGAAGGTPTAALVQANDGNFYGTTLHGGANGGAPGTIFKMTPSGTLTTLYSFCSQSGCADGEYPYDGLSQDTNGSFYGTTAYGGGSGACGMGCGTVFSLSAGLGPFVETQPTSGKVGAAIKILGTNLTGATSVTFNGTAATFTVVSNSLITTTVPAGATTGTVQVVTPGGTLSSNVPFRVVQ